jgi:chitodextrinase
MPIYSSRVLALTISNVKSEIGGTHAVINWLTDINATSGVKYGTSQSNLDKQIYDEKLVINHSLNLTNLESLTQYFYTLISNYTTDTTTISDTFSGHFTTKDIIPPVRVTGLVNTSITDISVTISWNRSDEKDFGRYIIYRDNKKIQNITNIRTTFYTDDNLNPSTTYIYEVSAMDSSGNEGEKSEKLIVTTKKEDTTAPVISNVTLAALTVNTATITWVTDELSNSSVIYGTTTKLSLTSSDNNFVRDHSITLRNLQNNTLYYYYIESCDKKGNCRHSSQDSFSPGHDITKPFINVSIPKYINTFSIDINGTTKPFTEIKFFVNNIYQGVLGKGSTGINGTISFKNLKGFRKGNNLLRIEARDSYGNFNQKELEIIVDTKPPEYTIGNIPRLTTEQTITINGSVNEPVTITVSVKSSKKKQGKEKAPSKVTGLTNVTIRENSVKLRWDENKEPDFDKYVIYRNDKFLTTFSYNEFTDPRLNTNTTYTYKVSALDTSCNEGELSDTLTITTLAGGSSIKETYPKNKEKCRAGRGEQKTISTNNSFSQEIRLEKGFNEITITITDLAGNSVTTKNSTVFDNEKPRIEYTNIKDLTPSYTRDITIKGKVSEQADVFVFLEKDVSIDYDNVNEPENVYTWNWFRDNSEKKTRTDEDGNFEIDITLRREARAEYVDDARTRDIDERFRAESGGEWRNQITIVAIDDAGFIAKDGPNEIVYAICGENNDWQINIENNDIYPSILIPRRLIEGREKFSFTGSLTWQGPGDEEDVSVDHIRLEKMPLSVKDQEKYDEEFIGRFYDVIPSPDSRAFYAMVDLKGTGVSGKNTTLEEEKAISQHRKGECAIPEYGCLKLPLMIVISYTYNDKYNPYQNETYRTQKQCWNVELLIDKRFPSDKIPKTFLKGMVNLLDTAIKVLDNLIRPINTLKKIVFVSCAGSWALWFVKKSKEYFSCFGVEPLTCNPDDGQQISITGFTGTKGDRCKACLKARQNTLKFWEKTTWLCDRVLCPSAPSITKYIKDVNNQKIDGKVYSHCKKGDGELPPITKKEDDITNNINYKAKKKDNEYKEYIDENKFNLEVRYPKNKKGEIIQKYGYPNNNYCEYEYLRIYDPVSIGHNELEESYCRGPGRIEESQDGTKCGGIRGWTRFLSRVQSGVCTRIERKRIIKTITPFGSSKSYTYVIDTDPNDPNKRAVWTGERVETYTCKKENQGGDNNINEDCRYAGQEIKGYVKKKDRLLNVNGDNGFEVGCKKDGKIKTYDELEEKYKNVKTNTDLYIPKDIWDEICFEEEEYALDPTADLITSFQSGCLTALSAYLQKWRDVMSIARACFKTILLTGDGSAGACKQFLSIYLCDLIYYAIRCWFHKFQVGYSGEKEVKFGFKGFFQYVSGAGANTEQSIMGRYGRTNAFNNMFVQKKLTHSFCAWAFTGDWDVDLNTLIESNVKTPIKSTCYINARRRFIRSNPSEGGRAAFLYHLGIVIVSGADDLKYKIQLVCSGDQSCGKDIDEYGRCDCSRIKEGEQVETIGGIGPGRLDQGQAIDEEYYEELERYWRFDKARILVSYKDNHGKEIKDELCNEVAITTVGGKPPASCEFDVSSLMFRCNFKWGELPQAYFSELTLDKGDNSQVKYYLEETINLKGVIEKSSPEKLKKGVPVYLRWSLYDDKKNELANKYEIPITKDGSNRIGKEIPQFPNLKIVNQGSNDNTVNPFTIRTTTHIGYKKSPEDDKVKVEINDGGNNINFSRFSITISKNNGDGYTYTIDRQNECIIDNNGDSNGNSDYNPKEGIECKIKNSGSTIKISGEPSKDSIKITFKPTNQREGNEVTLTLKVSLHAEDKDGKIIETPLRYNREPQERSFTFVAVNKKRESGKESSGHNGVAVPQQNGNGGKKRK